MKYRTYRENILRVQKLMIRLEILDKPFYQNRHDKLKKIITDYKEKIKIERLKYEQSDAYKFMQSSKILDGFNILVNSFK